MQFVRSRLLALILCVFCFAAAGLIMRMRASGAGASSMLAAFAAAAAFLMGFVFGALVNLPNRAWGEFHAAARRWLESLPEVDSSMSTRVATGLIVASGLAFLLIVAHLAPLQSPEHTDQLAYLNTATEIQRDGGVASLIGNLATGRFAEANRHPLYLALLSLWPTRAFGQGLSIVLGLLTLCGLAPLVMRKFGTGAAAVFATLLATNFACGYASTMVTCESLLVLLATVGWLWFGLPRRDDTRTDRISVSRPLAAGCWLGLMYLTKGTALLWLVGYCFWLVLTRERTETMATGATTEARSTASQPLWRRWLCPTVVVVGWALVSSPLLIRNAVRYGSPTYNVNSWLLFVDEYTDPETLANSTSLGEAAQRYWNEHSPGEIAKRGALGLVWEVFILVRSLGPTPLRESRILFGVPLLGLALLGMAIERRTDVRLLLTWLAICLPVFGWYVPVAAGERFILPLVPPLLVLASAGTVRLAQLLWRERAPTVLAIGCLVWLVVWTMATLRIGDLP